MAKQIQEGKTMPNCLNKRRPTVQHRVKLIRVEDMEKIMQLVMGSGGNEEPTIRLTLDFLKEALQSVKE